MGAKFTRTMKSTCSNNSICGGDSKSASGTGSSGNSGATQKFSYSDGRRYHAVPTAPYMMPNDLDEMDRLDLQHYMLLAATGRRHFAPIKDPKQVLDVGTGTGIWMMEMASEFPEASFLGLDIAPLQPETILPKNCRFEMVNVLEPSGMPYPSGMFDYIHHRVLFAAIPADVWPIYVKDCVRLTASGGWVEMCELTARLTNAGPCGQRMRELTDRMMAVRNVNVDMATRVDEMMHTAGLLEVTADIYRVPVGSWAGQVGNIGLEDYVKAFSTAAPILAKVNQLPVEEIHEMIEKIKVEVNEFQCCMEFYCYVGRKE